MDFSSTSVKFKEYLYQGSLEGLASIPKSDLHNHATNGGNVEYLKKRANINIEPPPKSFSSLSDAMNWVSINIIPYCDKFMRLEAAFEQAKSDGISVLAMSVHTKQLNEFGTYEQLFKILNELKNKYIPDTLFMPEWLIGTADVDKIMDEILSFNYFKSIDIYCGDDLDESIRNYKDIKITCRKAKKAGLKLKAHVGEYGTADDVMKAVEEWELDEVQHGIGAASSPQIMNWLAQHKIRLNVCPTSNIMLERVPSYIEHPIKKLYDYGVPVTINTDDMLIFNQSVSQEYLNLLDAGLMTAEELNHIREIGLTLKTIPTRG
jgi:adenosine deaminase